MYKSGKNWIVKSALSLAGGLALFSVSQSTIVKAEDMPISQSTTKIMPSNQPDDISDTENTKISAQDSPEMEVQPQAANSKSDIAERTINQAVKTSVTNSNETSEVGEIDQKPVLNNETNQSGNVQSSDASKSETLSNAMSGTWGTVNWEVKDDDEGRTLYLSPGTLADTSYDGQTDINPWSESLRSTIKRVSYGTYIYNGHVVAGSSTSGLFRNFTSLNTILNEDILDTSNTNDMSYMFDGCSSLKNVNASLFNWNKMTNFSHMFSNESSVEFITFPGSDRMSRADSTKLDYTSMFENDPQLKRLRIQSLDMSKTDKTQNLLKGDTDLQYLQLSNMSKLTDSGLGVGERDNRNVLSGSTGWILNPDGEYESTSGLVSMFNSTLNESYDGTTASLNYYEWSNFKPYIFQINMVDTTGKSIGKPFAINIPVGDKGADKVSTDDLTKQLAVLEQYGKFISGDESTGEGSYYKVASSLGDDLGTYYMTNDDEGNGIEFISQLINAMLESTDNPNPDSPDSFVYDILKFNIIYEPQLTENNHGSGSSSNRKVEGIEETIATYAEKPDIQLYDDNGSIITDRKLAPNSDWFTDESMQLNKDKFYRVATNQWAKVDDVYLYYPNESKVRVNSGSIARLVTDEGKAVTDRALQPLSNWYTDKYIYINDVKYYRVATNEFVSANDVTEY